MTIDRLYPAATYDKAKALSLVSHLNSEELAEETNYAAGEFVGNVYSVEVNGEFARIKITDADGEFVGYF